MSDHNQDEYLDPSDYLGHPTDDTGFNKFDKDGAHYFSKLDGDKIIFMSQGYSSEAGRNNGIESVKKNMVLNERYEVAEYKGQWYVSLKAGNRQEIAVSPLFATKAEANALVPGGGGSSASAGSSGVAASGGSAGGTVASGLSASGGSGSSSGGGSSKGGSSKIAPLVAGSGILTGFLGKTEIEKSSSKITKVNSTKTKYFGDDRYLSMGKYNDNLSSKSTIDGDFIQFSEGGKHYWGLLDSDGKMAIRSEGYASASDRDGAIGEISKGKWQGANYSILETREGKYYVLLKDGAHNEIGRSAAFSSRAKAVAFVPESGVTYATASSGGGGAAYGAMAAKASSSMAAASKSGFVAKAGGAAATAAATAFKAAPVIAPVATKAAAAAGWGLLPLVAGLFLLPLLWLLKPVPALVSLTPAAVAYVAPPPPVIPPPIPPPAPKVQLIGPKVGVKNSGF